jgi:methionyl-tRNA formyltransferase
MKILFMGTPEPAAKCLNALIDSGEEIIAVFTQPDRPSGRGLKVVSSAVKDIAQKNKIALYQPEKVKDPKTIELVKKLELDLIVVAAYGKILPKEIIDAPKFGSINVHASLLPKYRGAAPVQWALINGEKETGITIQKVFEALDTGDIILQEKVIITDEDNTSTLTEKLFNVGSRLLIDAIKLISSGKAIGIRQDEDSASYAPQLKKETGIIDWKKPTKKIFDLVRGCYPWPSAYTYYTGKLLKVTSASPGLGTHNKDAGTVVDRVEDEGFEVATGAGSLFIKEVQLEGGKRMHAWQFLNGHKLSVGDRLPN